MARIWDCSPEELVPKHLVAEHRELGVLFLDMLKPEYGLPRGRFTHHPEAKRFIWQPELLVARSDFLWYEAARRGYNFSQAWIANEHVCLEDYRLIEVWDYKRDWYSFRHDIGWPTSYGGKYWTPWKRDRMTKGDYLYRLGKKWSVAYKNGARPNPDPYRILVRGTI